MTVVAWRHLAIAMGWRSSAPCQSASQPGRPDSIPRLPTSRFRARVPTSSVRWSLSLSLSPLVSVSPVRLHHPIPSHPSLSHAVGRRRCTVATEPTTSRLTRRRVAGSDPRDAESVATNRTLNQNQTKQTPTKSQRTSIMSDECSCVNNSVTETMTSGSRNSSGSGSIIVQRHGWLGGCAVCSAAPLGELEATAVCLPKRHDQLRFLAGRDRAHGHSI